MIGNLIRMAAGRAVARQVGGTAAGPLGMVVGAALPAVLRRFGPLGMIGAAVGGYAYKKYAERRGRDAADPQLGDGSRSKPFRF